MIITLTMNPAIDKSSTINKILPEIKLRCKAPTYEPGGGGINVSRAISQLGGKSLAIYPAGGATGQMLQELLCCSGLIQRVIPISGLTRENMNIYEESTGQQFRFGMPGPHLIESEWQQCLEALGNINPSPDFVVASGSLPPGVPDDFYARVVRVARKVGAKTIIDTSGIALRRATEERVYLIKANLREFREMVGKELMDKNEIEEEAKKVITKGQSEIFVVSLGAAGIVGIWKNGCETICHPPVPEKSLVGTGDSTVAGIVLALSRGHSIGEALRFGVAAGSAAAMTAGTELCRGEDAERLYEEICLPDKGKKGHYKLD